jgi:hypothetical protein
MERFSKALASKADAAAKKAVSVKESVQESGALRNAKTTLAAGVASAGVAAEATAARAKESAHRHAESARENAGLVMFRLVAKKFDQVRRPRSSHVYSV